MTSLLEVLLNRLHANKKNFVFEHETHVGGAIGCSTCGEYEIVEEIDFDKLKEEIDKFSKEFQK
jgi:hypothetical protein